RQWSAGSSRAEISLRPQSPVISSPGVCRPEANNLRKKPRGVFLEECRLCHKLYVVASLCLPSARPFTGSPEAVARLRFPQNVAWGFPGLRSSEDGSQHCESL